MSSIEAQPLVQPDWLAAKLGHPQVRILDCSVTFSGEDDGYRLESGVSNWQASHIPGSSHVDLLNELSDNESNTEFMFPPVDQFQTVLEAHGVSDDSWVVLYDSGDVEWSARVWWMLRDVGFDRASLLEGGLVAWQRGNYPISQQAEEIPRGKVGFSPRRGVYVTKEDVLDAIHEPETELVSALSQAEHFGEIARYGRPGRIPGSKNIPYRELFDQQTRKFLSWEQIRAKIDSAGIRKDQKVITYCGGGVASSLLAFAFLQVGYPNVAVYDGSMLEWAADQSLPLETG